MKKKTKKTLYSQIDNFKFILNVVQTIKHYDTDYVIPYAFWNFSKFIINTEKNTIFQRKRVFAMLCICKTDTTHADDDVLSKF